MELLPPHLLWEAATPVATDFKDVYYSRMDGLAEARHVFLQGNGLPERLAKTLTIAETGFGTGLNFLALWQMWQAQHSCHPALVAGSTHPQAQAEAWMLKQVQHDRLKTSLHYITTELHPLSPQDIARALAAWPELEPLIPQFLAIYPPAIRGAHRRYLEGGRITIDFLFCDATEMLSRYQADAGEIKVDAWFLDGFAPAKNEALWNPALYAAMAKLSHEDTTLASFTAAGEVRRGLEAAGFTIQKTRGYGYKKEMIVGCYAPHIPHKGQSPEIAESQMARLRNSATLHAECAKKAIIIGAGIAGISSAWRLAQRGYQVTILEASGKICAGASGNPASAFTPFYPAKWNPRGRLLASGFHAMHHWLQMLRDKGHEIRGKQQGMLMLAGQEDAARTARMIAWQQSLTLPPEIRRKVDSAEASDLAGVPLTQSGWYYPMGGWVQMGDFCAALLADAGEKIEVLFQQKATALHHMGSWKVQTETDVFSADVVVVANATAAAVLLPEIKLEAVHGQLISFEPPAGWEGLRMPLHAGHTLIPAENNVTAQGAARLVSAERSEDGSVASGAALAPAKQYFWGASFRHHIYSPDILPEETEKLLEDLQIAFPELYSALCNEAPNRASARREAAGVWGGKPPNQIKINTWAGLRCTHASKLPLIGAVKNRPEGLCLNLAYGARGLVSAAIACDAAMFA
jgi:tRNA 5-methylaminomethyl-2-thiouridine biosynthesis bifunctional protein